MSQTRRPNWHHLFVFLKVAKHLSFSGAAREIGVSVATVSELVGKFEAVHGRLIEREAFKPIRLTELGQDLKETLGGTFDELEARSMRYLPRRPDQAPRIVEEQHA